MKDLSESARCCKCQAPIALNDKVCLSCGTMQKAGKTKTSKKKLSRKTGNNNKRSELQGGVFFIITLLCAYIYLFNFSLLLSPVDYLIEKGKLQEAEYFIRGVNKISLSKNRFLIQKKTRIIDKTRYLYSLVSSKKPETGLIKLAGKIITDEGISLRLMINNQQPFQLQLRHDSFIFACEKGQLLFSSEKFKLPSIKPWKNAQFDLFFPADGKKEILPGKLHFLQKDKYAIINVN